VELVQRKTAARKNHKKHSVTAVCKGRIAKSVEKILNSSLIKYNRKNVIFCNQTVGPALA